VSLHRTASIVGTVVVAALLATECAPRDTGALEAALRPVPFPALDAADQAVRDQLDAEYAELATRAEDGAVSAADRAEAYGGLGRLFMAASLLVTAEPALLNAHALAPTDPQWPYYLGHVYRIQGDAVTEAAMFEEAVRLDPEDLPARVWLGRAYLDQNRATDAEVEFLRALEVAPDSLAARTGLGRAELVIGDLARAVQELERVLETDPNAASAHYPLGLAYRGLGDEARARRHFALRGDVVMAFPDPRIESLALLLDNPQAFESRGLEALAAGRWDEAETQFREGLVVTSPGDAAARLSLMHKLGTALWLSGRVDEAVDQFDAGVSLSPAYALNHFSLGLVLASRGQLDDARQRFATAVEHDPDYVEARIALGDALLDLGQPEAAISHYARALQIAPDAADARMAQAAALAELGRLDEARQMLADGVTRHPGDRRFVDGLAMLLGF
jgi:tetratricopeptide (TPR) repeat protein